MLLWGGRRKDVTMTVGQQATHPTRDRQYGCSGWRQHWGYRTLGRLKTSEPNGESPLETESRCKSLLTGTELFSPSVSPPTSAASGKKAGCAGERQGGERRDWNVYGCGVEVPKSTWSLTAGEWAKHHAGPKCWGYMCGWKRGLILTLTSSEEPAWWAL